MKAHQKHKDEENEKLKRRYRQNFLFNELELAAFNKFCKKYKIKNRSRFVRETVMTAILKKFDQDYPSLFDLNELDPITEQSFLFTESELAAFNRYCQKYNIQDKDKFLRDRIVQSVLLKFDQRLPGLFDKENRQNPNEE